MTRFITRQIYRQILSFHPEPFRREFEDEILGMFEECSQTLGPSNLLADVLLSALKQQVQYFATPAPAKAPLYKEIVAAPRLARTLASCMLAIVLVAGLFDLSARTKRQSPSALHAHRAYSHCSEVK